MESLRIGIAGLGVVGSGVLDILLNRQERLSDAGVNLRVSGISARDPRKDRGANLSGIEWYADPVDLASSDDIDVFVELIGGASGPAKTAIVAALKNGKHVVTANKSLLADAGIELAKSAEENGLSLCYEAAVAGGIPLIRGLKDGAGACRVERVTGMLNGTCNYILTQMTNSGASYTDALKEAQALGYAEANPALDVSGADAGQKLAILATIAFGAEFEFGSFPVTGIEALTAEDIWAANQLGYRIKLLATANNSDQGTELRVHPALVDENHSLAKAEGADNYIIADCDPLGQLTFAGPGAGSGATASAVVADLIALARGMRGPVFSHPATSLTKSQLVQSQSQPARFYLRLNLKDVPGAIAGISEILADHSISIDSLIQPSVSASDVGSDNHEAMVVLATHETTELEMAEAANEIKQKPFALGEPSIIRIEDFAFQK